MSGADDQNWEFSQAHRRWEPGVQVEESRKVAANGLGIVSAERMSWDRTYRHWHVTVPGRATPVKAWTFHGLVRKIRRHAHAAERNT